MKLFLDIMEAHDYTESDPMFVDAAVLLGMMTFLRGCSARTECLVL